MKTLQIDGIAGVTSPSATSVDQWQLASGAGGVCRSALTTPYQCAVCQRRFSDILALGAHVDVHANSTVTTAVPRSDCDEFSADRAQYQESSVGVSVTSQFSGESSGTLHGDIDDELVNRVHELSEHEFRKLIPAVCSHIHQESNELTNGVQGLSDCSALSSVSTQDPEFGRLETSVQQLRRSDSTNSTSAGVPQRTPYDPVTGFSEVCVAEDAKTSVMKDKRLCTVGVVDVLSEVVEATGIRRNAPVRRSQRARKTRGDIQFQPAADSVEEPAKGSDGGEESSTIEGHPLQCGQCGRRLAHKQALARHMQRHTGAQLQFTCEVCGHPFRRADSLSAHAVRQHGRTDGQYPCPQCDKRYPLHSLLQRHQDLQHGDYGAGGCQPQHRCDLCGRCTSTAKALRRHSLTQHGASGAFQCELCDKSYSRLDSLITHALIHVAGDIQSRDRHPCPVCRRCYTQARILQYHVDSAHKGEDHGGVTATRVFLCDVCGKRFKTSGKLSRHVRVHSGERPWACDVCGHCFSDESALRQHRHTHTGHRPHQCHQCGLRFLRSTTLAVHARTHTGERPFSCTTCTARFATCTQLKRHTRIHTGHRPYSCHLCARTFTQSTHRNVHLRSHRTSTALYAEHMID